MGAHQHATVHHIELGIPPLFTIVPKHHHRRIVNLVLHEESYYLAKPLLKSCLSEQGTGEEVIRCPLLLFKRIEELAALRENPEETVKALQVGTAQEGYRLQFLLGHLLDTCQRGLAPVEHLHKTLRQLADGHFKTDGKGILVAVAEGTAVKHPTQELLGTHPLQQIAYGRMLWIIRYKPVANHIEEREALHLGETTEIDVRPLLLHVGHSAHILLQFFHPLFRNLRVQNVLHRVILHLLNAVARHANVIVLQQFRDNLALDDLVVALCPQTIEHLHLQLSQFISATLIIGYLLQHLVNLGIQLSSFRIKTKHPPYQSTLTHTLVS